MTGEASDIDSRRRSERIAVRLAAELGNDWEQRCSAEVINISRGGVAIEGGHQLIAVAFPNFNPSRGNQRPVIDLRFGLLEGAEQLQKPWVEVCCRSAYVKRTGAELFVIGLSIAPMNERTLEVLDRFLTGLRCSAERLSQIPVADR